MADELPAPLSAEPTTEFVEEVFSRIPYDFIDRFAVRQVLLAADLPSRDARVRAQVAEEVRSAIGPWAIMRDGIAEHSIRRTGHPVVALYDAVVAAVTAQHATEPVGQTEGQDRTEGEVDG